MQHNEAITAPRRTLLWDEAAAKYVWLDDRARAAAALTRAKRLEFQAAVASHYACALADLYVSSDYDTRTRNVAQCCKSSAKRKSAARADRARAAAKPIAAKPKRAKRAPMFLDEIADDLIAALAVL